MQLYDYIFYLFAAITVVSALVVVFSRNVIYSAFALMFTFLGVAGLYVLLQADFLAIAQIMIYVGGILVLLIFGVMLTNKVTDVEIKSGTIQVFPGTIIIAVLLGTLILIMTKTIWSARPVEQSFAGTTNTIGELLMTTFLLPFEAVAVLLLVAIMGAALLARKQAS